MLKLYVVAFDTRSVSGIDWYSTEDEAIVRYEELHAEDTQGADAIYRYEVIVPGQTADSLELSGTRDTITTLIDQLNWDHHPDELHLNTFNLITGDYA